MVINNYMITYLFYHRIYEFETLYERFSAWEGFVNRVVNKKAKKEVGSGLIEGSKGDIIRAELIF